MGAELLPCPFCGSPGELDYDQHDGSWDVSCSSPPCWARLSRFGGFERGRELAVTAWNTRFPARPPTTLPVHDLATDPGASIAGRVNRIIADVLGVEDSRVVPGVSLAGRPTRQRGWTESGPPLDADDWQLGELGIALADEFDMDDYGGWIFGCATIQDVHDHVAAWVEARVGAGVRNG